MIFIGKMIKQEFKGSEALLFGAGKFMILAKNEHREKIKEIQKELDSYFLENFFGQNGFILSTQITTKDKILSQKDSMQTKASSAKELIKDIKTHDEVY